MFNRDYYFLISFSWLYAGFHIINLEMNNFKHSWNLFSSFFKTRLFRKINLCFIFQITFHIDNNLGFCAIHIIGYKNK